MDLPLKDITPRGRGVNQRVNLFSASAQAMLQALSRPPSGFYSLGMTIEVVSKSYFQVPGKGRDRKIFGHGNTLSTFC